MQTEVLNGWSVELDIPVVKVTCPYCGCRDRYQGVNLEGDIIQCHTCLSAFEVRMINDTKPA